MTRSGAPGSDPVGLGGGPGPSGGALEVVTPTYGPDLELCGDLRASVLALGDSRVTQRVVVPRRDLDKTRHWASERVSVSPASDFLPPWMVPAPRNFHLDLARPWWPVRGWITQQIIKLEATARSAADLVLVADSDVVFVRPFGLDAFRDHGRPRFYRLSAGVHPGMPRHVAWHSVSRWLLGLDPKAPTRSSDYICWPCPWEPAVVRAMLERIEECHGRPWQRLVAASRHFSEMILYGVFVDEVLGASSARRHTAQMRCQRHSDEAAHSHTALDAFIADRSDDDVAIMISARSGTPPADRRAALRRAGLFSGGQPLS